MIKKIKPLLPLTVILLLSFLAVKPLLVPGFFPMHDDEQIARLYELHQSLLAGQFPPRWVSNLGFGYGYPFYNFYPPLVYYLGEIFHLLGFSLISSTKIVMGLGFFLSGIFIYFLAKEFFGALGGLVAAIFYIYAPYHALDLYVRGSLAEFFTFVFLPAVFWSTFKLIKEKSKKWLIINSLFLSFLLLSHNFIVLILVPFYFIYFLFFFSFEKDKKKTVLLLFFSFLLFLGLTCYFWLPALYERKYTLVDTILTRELASYKLHFVYLRQLWNSPWGYGGSIYGLEDGISFEVGKVHLVLSFSAAIVGLYLFLRKRKLNTLLVFFFLFLFSLFMTSFHSQFIWDRIKPFWYLQFPWRFLIFTSLFSSLLSGGVISLVFKWFKKQNWLKWIMPLGFIILVIAFSVNYFQPAHYIEVTDDYYTNEEDLKWRVSGFSFEFVPKTVGTKLSEIGTTQLDISREEIAKSSYEILVGDLKVKEVKNLPHRKIFETEGEGRLKVNTYWFPGWKVFLDKNEIMVEKVGKLSLISFEIPRGNHRVEVLFTNTPVRALADLLSFLSFLGLVWWCAKIRLWKRQIWGRLRDVR